MAQKKQSIKQTIQLIIDILSFETSAVELKQRLETTIVDWDPIVMVASQHLVLPAIYCRLQQKSLLDCIPNDLEVYLEKLTQLNRDRNQTLLYEVEQISKTLNEHRIKHVFIKGIALLAGNYFKDIGERMVGDIDILVDSKDLDNAFNILVREGYSQFIDFNYKVKNYRHLPRQICEERIGAIELHDQLLKHKYNHLIDKTSFLRNKEIKNGIAIPNSEHLIQNTILAQQINDQSYYYNLLKLKGVYDVFAVGLPKNTTLIEKLSNEKYSLGFLSLTSIFSQNISPSKETIVSLKNKYCFNIALIMPKFGYRLFKTKSLYLAIKERISLFFFNKSYRNYIIKNRLIK